MAETKERAVVRLMLKTLFSTTLRIFAPTTICFLIGLALDLNAPTKPWGMMAGTVVGIIIAVLLVVKQLGQIRKSSDVTKILQEVK